MTRMFPKYAQASVAARMCIHSKAFDLKITVS
jgi:hypothetical protein